MSLRLSGRNPLSYLGVEPLQPPDLVYIHRNPISGAVANADYRNYNVGTLWLNPDNQTLWILVKKPNNTPLWIQLGITAAGFLQTLTADDAVAVAPFNLNINVFGDANITTTGNNLTHVLKINLNPNISVTNINVAGTATINNLTVTGTTDLNLGRGVVQSDGAGILFADEGTDGQLLISSSAGAPAWANITSGDGSVVITNGANSIDLSAAAAPGDIHFISGNDAPATVTGGTILIQTANSTVKFLKTAANALTLDFMESNLILGTDPSLTIVSALENVGFGVNTYLNLISGQENVAVGFGAGQALQGGDANIAIGKGAYFQAIDANNNIAIGKFALGGVVDNASANNIALGNNALVAMTNADFNVAIGNESLNSVTTGSNNVALGYLSGASITNTSDNIMINNIGVVGDTGVTRIGSNGIQTSAFMAGIRGIVPAGALQMVTINPSGQLGSQAIPAGGGSGVIIVTTYTTPGAGVWTKNANTRWIQLNVWNGGGGGGSGRQGASGASSGGAGGSVGNTFQWYGSASSFDPTENFFVGSGGAGGIAQAAANTNGNPGSAGTASIFGKFQPFTTFTGGGGGGPVQGNISNQGAGAVTNFGIYLQVPFAAAGQGLIVTGSPGGTAGLAGIAALGGTGGGGGGGADSGTIWGGGAGGNITSYAGVVELAGGTAGIESGTINGGNGNVGLTSGGFYSGGTGGGGGGGQSAGPVAGIGGNGAQPSAGGGGGGGSLNGTNSGAGGSGGDGMIIVIEWT